MDQYFINLDDADILVGPFNSGDDAQWYLNQMEAEGIEIKFEATIVGPVANPTAFYKEQQELVAAVTDDLLQAKREDLGL